MRLKLSKNYTFSLNATWATYAYEFNESGQVIVGNRTEWSYGRFGRFHGVSSRHAVAACILTIGTITLQNIYGLYSLVAVSGCMSLMFPTIYGIALKGVGKEAKLGAAGLIMAILGGSVLPPLQAMIIDMGNIAGLPAINISFVLPLICFAVITIYGNSIYKQSANQER